MVVTLSLACFGRPSTLPIRVLIKTIVRYHLNSKSYRSRDRAAVIIKSACSVTNIIWRKMSLRQARRASSSRTVWLSSLHLSCALARDSVATWLTIRSNSWAASTIKSTCWNEGSPHQSIANNTPIVWIGERVPMRTRSSKTVRATRLGLFLQTSAASLRVVVHHLQPLSLSSKNQQSSRS